VRLAVSLSRTSTVTSPATGEWSEPSLHGHSLHCDFLSILEYLSRDDADRAVKDLDSKDLRGRPVRVALDDSVRSIDNHTFGRSLMHRTAAWWTGQLPPRRSL
jgi:hypothetical protein